MGRCVVALGGAAEPLHRLRIIHGFPFQAVSPYHAHHVLGLGIPAQCCGTEQRHRLPPVLLGTGAVGVQVPEGVRRIDGTGVRCLGVAFERLPHVLLHAVAVLVQGAQHEKSLRVAPVGRDLDQSGPLLGIPVHTVPVQVHVAQPDAGPAVAGLRHPPERAQPFRVLLIRPLEQGDRVLELSHGITPVPHSA